MGKSHGASYGPISDVDLAIIKSNNLTSMVILTNDQYRKFLQQQMELVL